MQSPLDFLRNLIHPDTAKLGISSIWGDFGVGKTTLCFQFLLFNLLNNNSSVYIYTKPNFPFAKLSKIFENVLDKIPNHIVFLNCTDFDDLYNLIFKLEFLLLQNNKQKNRRPKLIIIDSLTDLYRLELDQEKKDKNFLLNYKLNTILGNLAYLNKSYETNIIVVNEASQRTIEGDTVEIEAGGKVMDYWIANSLKLERITTLNERKLIIKAKYENHTYEFKLRLNSYGFLHINQ